MPRKAAKVPAYCLHKASGRAVARVNGKDHYLGPFGSPESHERYAELIERWRLAKASPVEPSELPPSVELSVNELLLKYWDYAESYYSSQGQPTKELICMRDALRPVKRLYGHTLVRDFGPKSLKSVREFMITDQQLARSVVNQRIGRIKRVFKWGVAEELIAPSILHGLQAVEGLRRSLKRRSLKRRSLKRRSLKRRSRGTARSVPRKDHLAVERDLDRISVGRYGRFGRLIDRFGPYLSFDASFSISPESRPE